MSKKIPQLSVNTKKPTFVRKTVSPKLAKTWLEECNKGNRTIRRSTVRAYQRELETGEWDEWGNQSIAFDTDGILRDGQHRLRAIELSGKSVGMWVYVNMPAESSTYIDIGAKRNLHDRTKLPVKITALITFHKATVLGETTRCTPEDAKKIYRKMKKGFDWAYDFRYTGAVPNWTCQGVRYAFAEYYQKSAAHADSFRERFYLGIGCKKGCPTLALRAFLIEHGGNHFNRKAFYLAAKAAMDADYEGKKMQSIEPTEDMLTKKKVAHSAYKESMKLRNTRIIDMHNDTRIEIDEILEVMNISRITYSNVIREAGLPTRREMEVQARDDAIAKLRKKNPSMALSEIAQHLGVSYQTVWGRVKAMEEQAA